VCVSIHTHIKTGPYKYFGIISRKYENTPYKYISTF